MNEEKLELNYIFDKTVDWMKFAEAKNGALLAINSAILFGVSRVILTSQITNTYLISYISIAAVFLSASILVSLLSFLPRLESPIWVSFPRKPEKINLLFFGHICSVSPNSYLKEYYKIIGAGENQYSESDNQLANQIVANSKIAFIKYKQFNIAIWLTISALLTPIGSLFIAKIRV